MVTYFRGRRLFKESAYLIILYVESALIREERLFEGALNRRIPVVIQVENVCYGSNSNYWNVHNRMDIEERGR